MPLIQSNCATTPLEEQARYYLNLNAEHGYNGDMASSYQQLANNGGHYLDEYLGEGLLLTSYREYRRDINKLLAEAQGIGGRPPGIMPLWDGSDPLALKKHNRRLLAKFGLSEAMKRVYHRHNGENRVHQETADMEREVWQGRWAIDYGSVLPDWLSRPELASTQWLSEPSGLSSPVLPTTGQPRPEAE